MKRFFWNNRFFVILVGLSLSASSIDGTVKLGVDCLFSSSYESLLVGKQIGLVTNHTAINSEGKSTIDLFKTHARHYGYTLETLFAPEHGLHGISYASELIGDEKDSHGLPIYSLHGKYRRPTRAMLKNISLLVYDIQDIGSRSYTYSSTLFYLMEEAAKAQIPVVVLDRPNPLGGLLVDGPMLEDKWRSFVGYINVPYCHGLTIGEMAKFFNDEYKVGCDLAVIPMQGWKRQMTFAETGLLWIPTSPQIPESQTTFYYPITGMLGELSLLNMGVGYTLPFRVLGAPWIDAQQFAQQLNAQNYPGVYFSPFHYRPFFGRFARQNCHGVLITVTNPKIYLPVTTQYLLLGILKNLYPLEFKKALEESKPREEMFNKVNGTNEIYRILKEEKYFIWKLKALHLKERRDYLSKRELYLIPHYH